MRVLIDTHYVLWAAKHPKRMETLARSLAAGLDNEALVSVLPVYQTSLTVRLGELPEASAFESDLTSGAIASYQPSLSQVARSCSGALQLVKPAVDLHFACVIPDRLFEENRRCQSRLLRRFVCFALLEGVAKVIRCFRESFLSYCRPSFQN